ncbi:MAG: capsular biosynthesis protein [Polyangiaceae bacterium]|nr:capsular biosynthesis protein [Polyangiaceae bacterium]
MLREFRGRHLLLLQGPNGPFFKNVARHLNDAGARVSKVNFNPGDALFYGGPEVTYFRGDLESWPDYFARLVEERGIDAVMVFGDCRVYHRLAIARAHALGIDVFVFEEGYLRPDFVTLERDGVNGHSKIPKDAAFYRELQPRETPPPRRTRHVFLRAAWFSGLYALANSLFGWRYPHYRHHRDLNALRQARLWGLSGLRRIKNAVRDRGLDTKLLAGTMTPYFLVPLQVHLDSQIGHSRFRSVAEFIEIVVASFAKHAPADATLILKHHPFDRPYREYTRLISDLARRHSLGSRLVYADVINLPAALRHARGTVVINSTVGLSSLYHGTPVKCLGTPVYDFEGLTYQGSLDDFWNDPGTVDAPLTKRFTWWLRVTNQLNGNVWSDIYSSERPTQNTSQAEPEPPSHTRTPEPSVPGGQKQAS